MTKNQLQACENLKYIRIKYNYTVSEFALLLNIKPVILSRIEENHIPIPNSLYETIEDIFNISKAKLFLQDFDNRNCNQKHLVAHLKNGFLIPFYGSDFNTLASIEKESFSLINRYGNQIDFIECAYD